MKDFQVKITQPDGNEYNYIINDKQAKFVKNMLDNFKLERYSKYQYNDLRICILLSKGCSVGYISEILQIPYQSLRRHIEKYALREIAESFGDDD